MARGEEGRVRRQSELWPEGTTGFGGPGKEEVPITNEPPEKPPKKPPTESPKEENKQRPPEVAGDRKPAATQSLTGNRPLPIPRTNNGEGMNMATWVSIWQDWGREMLRLGFLPDQLPAIAEAQGEHFPKSLVATFNAQDALGPNADMLQQYDYDHFQQRSYPHKNADYPEGTGFGEWGPIPQNVLQSHNDFYSWKENPANYAWIDKFGGHAYTAWMASPTGRGAPFALQQNQQGFGSPVSPVTPVVPKPDVPVTPVPRYPDSPTATASVPRSTQRITNELSGYGNPLLGGGGGVEGFGAGASAGSATSGNYGKVTTGGPRVTSSTRRPAQPSLYPTRPTAGSTGAIRYRG